MFSGLNLAFFSITKLKLEIESKNNNLDAIKIAKLREDSNFLLTTILWGNVSINVLLTLLSNSVMAGALSFVFSTFVITFLGEIIPQAYFSRHAMRTASALSPVLRFYQFLLYPVAKPSAIILDKWLGQEGIQFFREKDFRELLMIHIDATDSDIDKVEGKGALNFLAIDDLSIAKEGELIATDSIVEMDFVDDKPVFPKIEHTCDDLFLQQVHRAQKKWTVLTNREGVPKLALDSDGFLTAAIFEKTDINPLEFCHRPIIVRDSKTLLGEAILQLKVKPERSGDVIDKDVILFWGDEKRVITGADILGRLLKGIVVKK